MTAETDTKDRWPGECDIENPAPFVTIPPQLSSKKPGQLTDEQLKQYFDEGYVRVDNFFKPEELNGCRDQIKELVEEFAQKLHKAGKIKNLYREYGLFQRLIMINKEFPGANVNLHGIGKLPKAFRSAWSHQRLLNVVEQLLGSSDILGHPVWNLRTKTPHDEETTVPWHQDNAYFPNEAYHQHVVTAWIPMLDTNETNGCMQMAKFGHRKGKVAKHSCCAGGTWYVMLDEDEMRDTLGVDIENDIVVEPVTYGSILLFSNMLPHRSLNNVSNDVRWSMDLRWTKDDKSSDFFGLKGGIRMRSAENPDNFTITEEDWEQFDSKSRHPEGQDEFATTLHGPWMSKWEVVHTNRHTNASKDGEGIHLISTVG